MAQKRQHKDKKSDNKKKILSTSNTYGSEDKRRDYGIWDVIGDGCYRKKKHLYE